MEKMMRNSISKHLFMQERCCSRFGRSTYVQNERAARHPVHRFVEKSCGGGRVSSTGLVIAQLLIALLINVEAGHSFHSVLTFQ